ncbi:MAG: FAD-binding protein, partial [Coriobacteriales bacterium]|nr:FAD-binding protein [Coriobacteriales bacterium]
MSKKNLQNEDNTQSRAQGSGKQGKMPQWALDRRNFLKAAAGLGATAAVATMLPGCAPAGNDGTSSGATNSNGSTVSSAFPSYLGEPPIIDESQIIETIETDIVVVGGGNAGVMCACAAAEGGKTVSVIEAQNKDTIWYWGLHDIATQNSKYALSKGINQISKTEFLAEFQRRTHNMSDPRLVKKYIDNSGEMMDWLMDRAPQEVLDKLHIAYFTTNNQYFEEGSSINNFKCWNGYIQIDFQSTSSTLIAEAESKGATWYWEHTAAVLDTETSEAPVKKEHVNADGTVTWVDETEPQTTVKGVIVQAPDGGYKKFVGTKGVVLTCGDYGGNPQMYSAFQDEVRKLYESHGLDAANIQCAGFGRDGSGIKMGMWVGGSIDPSPHALVKPQVMFASDDFATNVLRWGSGFTAAAEDLPAGTDVSQNPWGTPFVCVDSTGKRFTDENFLGVFGMTARIERKKPGRYYFFFDKKWKETMSRQAPEHFSQPVGVPDSVDYDAIFNSWVERGAEGAATEAGGTTCAWAANSLDELFEYMGFDAEMKASVKTELERYNGFCANGEDEDFARDPKLLQAISEPPFFGMYSVEEQPMPGPVALNGLVIDDNQRVL